MTVDLAVSTADAATPASVAAAARAWIADTWDPERPLVEWRRMLVDEGWAVPSWPTRWHGRGLPGWADDVVAAEIAAAGVVGTPFGSGMVLAAPTILAHGPDAVRERYLRPCLTGEETWCQLFSEPSAGSDLAGLTTRAVLDGDRWIINGQKVWNTSADHCDYGLLLARTDADVPKHRGITYFAIPMRQEGVEVRGLAQMNGHSSFNEVFFSDAIVPVDGVIGEVGQGWPAALTTLAFERKFRSMTRPKYTRGTGRAFDEAMHEADVHFEPYKWYPQRAGRVDLAIEHARLAGVSADPVVRQAVAQLLALQRASALTADRARAARAQGRPPGAEGSIGKLSLSNVARQAARVHSLIAGANGMLTGEDSVLGGVIAEVLLSVPAQSIAGGTDEIQKNILAEKALGLPREPQVDKDVPFREVMSSKASRSER